MLSKTWYYMRPGDTLVVWRLSRLARSLKQIIETAHELEQKKQLLKVLTRNIDTGTPEGRLFFHITAAFDEFQRELIIENTKAGLAAAAVLNADESRSPSLCAVTRVRYATCCGFVDQASLHRVVFSCARTRSSILGRGERG